MLGGLSVFTLRSAKTMTQFSSLFWASNQPSCLLQCSRLVYESVFDALLFSSSYWPVGKNVSHQVITRPTFSFFFGSSYRPSFPPRCSGTTLWLRPWGPLNFSSLFRSIGSLLPIGRHSTSLRSARLQTSWTLSWFIFSFWTDMHAIWLVDRFKTSSWPSQGRCTYTSLGGFWDTGHHEPGRWGPRGSCSTRLFF
jgi:hypothetical protein